MRSRLSVRVFLTGAAVLSLLLLANAIAALVVLILGLTLQAVAPGSTSHWPWVAIGAAGVAVSIVFMKGCLSAPRWLAARRPGSR